MIPGPTGSIDRSVFFQKKSGAASIRRQAGIICCNVGHVLFTEFFGIHWHHFFLVHPLTGFKRLELLDVIGLSQSGDTDNLAISLAIVTVAIGAFCSQLGTPGRITSGLRQARVKYQAEEHRN